MKVLNAEFVTSAADARGIPRDGLPQIALVGRSNVGKSTLINALAGRKIAQTSAKPGKTRLANLYRVHAQGGRPDASGAPGSWRFYLVDLPGYGYARGGKEALGEFAHVTGEYFGAVSGVEGVESGTVTLSDSDHDESVTVPLSKPLTAVLLIVDARHPGLEADLAARDWIATLARPHVVVATKTDKLSRSARARAVREVERRMNGPVLPVSAETGEGLDELWTHIVTLASSR
ncbi:MAG: GTP-binding protein [Acidobacteria bacterium]|nr:GTP-binding protein [Acidobacteriota bacterium]